MSKCYTCGHSRIVVSENGLHPVCCLSPKKAALCVVDQINLHEEVNLKSVVTEDNKENVEGEP